MLRKANVKKTESSAFFSTPGTPRLYSGVIRTYASAAAIMSFHAPTTGSENTGAAMSPTDVPLSAKNGSAQSRRSTMVTSNRPSAAHDSRTQ